MNILFRAPNWLGDAVVSRILLYNLKKYRITVICKDNLKDIFHDYERITFRDKRELFVKSLKLRKREFDTGIVVPLSFSSAFYMYIAHPAERIGFSFEGRDIFLTKRVKIPPDWKKKHTITTQFLLLEELGIEPLIPDTYFTPLCNNTSIIPLQPSSYITIAPFAAFGHAKEWGLENYIETARVVFEEHGLKTVILGSSKDIYRISNLQLPNFIISTVGKTSLMEAACIIKNSSVFIGNDSGLSHLSAAMGHPTITIFGPTSPVWTKPIGTRSYFLWKPSNCAPCYLRECPFETKQCMENISIKMLLENIRSILNSVN